MAGYSTDWSQPSFGKSSTETMVVVFVVVGSLFADAEEEFVESNVMMVYVTSRMDRFFNSICFRTYELIRCWKADSLGNVLVLFLALGCHSFSSPSHGRLPWKTDGVDGYVLAVPTSVNHCARFAIFGSWPWRFSHECLLHYFAVRTCSFRQTAVLASILRDWYIHGRVIVCLQDHWIAIKVTQDSANQQAKYKIYPPPSSTERPTRGAALYTL
jgi:hypothetical protein